MEAAEKDLLDENRGNNFVCWLFLAGLSSLVQTAVFNYLNQVYLLLYHPVQKQNIHTTVERSLLSKTGFHTGSWGLFCWAGFAQQGTVWRKKSFKCRKHYLCLCS